MTPYGQSGPQSELTGFDFTAFYALGGVMGLMGDPNDKLMRAGNESYRTGARNRLSTEIFSSLGCVPTPPPALCCRHG